MRFLNSYFLIFNCFFLLFSLAQVPVALAERPLASARNVTQIGHLDIDGGGIVQVHGNYAYIGHMEEGVKGGTSIVDVSDPKRPRLISRIFCPPGVHSHKVRVDDELQIMMVNYEQYGSLSPKQQLGLAIFDITNKSKPRLLTIWSNGGYGVHRMTYDPKRKYAFLGADVKDYNRAIVVVLDLKNPKSPTEVARWWFPGQGPGESFARDEGGGFRAHHPIVGADGNFYIGYWNGGYVIAKANWDRSRTKLLGFQKEPLVHVNWTMTFRSPGHTLLPVDHKIGGWDIVVMTDEALGSMDAQYQPCMWIAVLDKARPDRWVLTPIATFRVKQPPFVGRFGAHQPHEYIGPDNLVYVAWFAGGLRIVDIKDPFQPREVGYFVPGPAPGQEFAATNDVFVKDGLIYLIDRVNGLEIVKWEKQGRRGK